MDPDSFSGWGVRTLATGEARYNPMAYHNGSVWPHDNALIAYGFARYGLEDLAVRVLSGLFEAATSFELHRMPELFCGFARRAGRGPDPLSSRLCPAGVGGRRGVPALAGVPRTGHRRRRAADLVSSPSVARLPGPDHHYQHRRGRRERRPPAHPA